LCLRNELIFHTYRPKKLKTFILRDPKTRKISKSDFRDRVVHHALCNVIEPIFEKRFIFDSYANRKGKGTLRAIQRFDYFKRKVSKNNKQACFVLKADIRHYFETVSHNVLVNIIRTRIDDGKIIWLVKTILSNYNTKEIGNGMPLGNLTSQFFANVYLNELDQFVKHKLRAKYYIRYVDDFVILDSSKEKLDEYKCEVNNFLKEKLHLELHPDKTTIVQSNLGVTFLGLRIFMHHKLLKKSNMQKFVRKLRDFCEKFDEKLIDYDKVYNFLEGWTAYSKQANVFRMRKNLLLPLYEKFAGEVSTKEYNQHLQAVLN
jgi:retron-type reverse transcriptase